MGWGGSNVKKRGEGGGGGAETRMGREQHKNKGGGEDSKQEGGGGEAKDENCSKCHPGRQNWSASSKKRRGDAFGYRAFPLVPCYRDSLPCLDIALRYRGSIPRCAILRVFIAP